MKNTKAFGIAVLVLALATLACTTAGTIPESTATVQTPVPTFEPSVTPTPEVQFTSVTRSETYGYAGPTSTPAGRSETYGRTGPAPNPMADIDGIWVGITSQSVPSQTRSITITIVSNTVVSIEFDMLFAGEGWSAETHRYAPVSVPVEKNQFEFKLNYTDTVFYFTAGFAEVSSEVELRGIFEAYHAHPQGLGNAEGGGLFVARKQ